MVLHTQMLIQSMLSQGAVTKNYHNMKNVSWSYLKHFYKGALKKTNGNVINKVLCRQISTANNTEQPTHQENILNNEETTEGWTHFGYKKVKEEEKVRKVHHVFENVADKYDLMNDVMSSGVHRLWKHYYVGQMNLKHGMKILDMAGGTGDIAFKILDKMVDGNVQSYNNSDTGIIVSDINQAMLDVGKQRASRLRIEKEFDWVKADAEDLPFDDDSFDLYSIAFGIRNVTHIEKVLDEAYRVLKPGGRFTCLEFSNVDNPLIKSLYDTYSFQFIPIFGSIFADDWDSYQYLVESIRQFPDQEDFSDLIYDAGFSHVMYENLTFGVVAIHDGFKL